MENVKRQIWLITPEDGHDFKGPVTLILSVVAPTLFRSMDLLVDPQTLTFFFLALSNLEDEIHFKCGRFVTSQNWECYINN